MMEYFAGLDVSMEETHICVLDREGAVVRETRTASTAEAIAQEMKGLHSAGVSSSRPGAWRRCSIMDCVRTAWR